MAGRWTSIVPGVMAVKINNIRLALSLPVSILGCSGGDFFSGRFTGVSCLLYLDQKHDIMHLLGCFCVLVGVPCETLVVSTIKTFVYMTIIS